MAAKIIKKTLEEAAHHGNEQGDQLYMGVLFSFLVKCAFPVYATVQYTYTSVTLHKVPEQHGHVYLVNL